MYKLKDPITNEEISYHIDKKILYLLDRVKETLTKRDKDYVMLIDGYEGSGKSTFATQMGKHVDPTLDLSRVCMTADEFKQAIIDAKKGQCVIYDEAVTGLSAGSAITKVGRILKSMMMQMRQKNLFVIVILPIVFEFNKYAVLSRARFFLHVYETGGRMGYFVGYNKKDTRETYLRGKKTHSYKVRSRFTGRFYGKFGLGKKIEPIYRKKKEETLFLAGEEEETPTKYLVQRNILICDKYDELGTINLVVEWLKKVGTPLSHTRVGVIVQQGQKIRENREKSLILNPLTI